MFQTMAGEGIEAGASTSLRTACSDDVIEWTRDRHMLMMRREGVPLRVIARYFNLNERTVRRRCQAYKDRR